MKITLVKADGTTQTFTADSCILKSVELRGAEIDGSFFKSLFLARTWRRRNTTFQIMGPLRQAVLPMMGSNARSRRSSQMNSTRVDA
jgi:hypothetical protein